MNRISNGFPAIALIGLAGALLLPTPSRAAGQTGCFNVRVEFVGRQPDQLIRNVQYYRWTYRVYGINCINRGLSHWVLGLCTSQLGDVRGISTHSSDGSDPSHGTDTFYGYELGRDPATGVTGLKWNYQTGNAIDRVNEYDEFSFVASGTIVEIDWAAKGATFIVRGRTFGPSCAPVPVQNISWGAVKAIYAR